LEYDLKIGFLQAMDCSGGFTIRSLFSIIVQSNHKQLARKASISYIVKKMR